MVYPRWLVCIVKPLLLITGLIFIGVVYSMWGTSVPQLVKICIPVENLPASLDGFSIIHLSDLHSGRFGPGQRRVLRLLKNKQVDMVVITGDMVDAHKKDIEPCLELVDGIGTMAPVYFVPGNHESASRLYGRLKKELLERSVIVLDDGSGVNHPAGDGSLTVIGVGLNGKTALDCEKLREKGPVVLLSHYPEVFEAYAGGGVDLILAGHTHGGQIRLPFVGALWVPKQGKFPQYDAGLFYKDGCHLYINRGLGTSGIPLRFMCRPEVTLITLTGG